MNTEIDPSHTPGWEVTLRTTATDQDDPLSLLRQLDGITPITHAVAQYRWDDPECIATWACRQADMVLVETLATTRLAQQSNVDTLHTMRQALANLLQNTSISLDALSTVLEILQESVAKAQRLRVLAKTLQSICLARGLAIQTPLNVSIWLDRSTHTVMNRETGLTFSDENAFGTQLSQAMESVRDVPAVEDDGRASPYEELMAIFSREWKPA